MLLPFVIDNLLLAATSLLFTAHLLFGFCFSLIGLSSLAPCHFIASWLNAYYMSLAIPHSLLRFTVRFLAFVSGKSPLAPRRLF